MDLCSKQNIKGVIASIDQTKAFDSVSHAYMEKVYDFFNFGHRVKSWLKSIGTNRTASVALSNGTLSQTFPLGKGHAQGDSPSPLLYNLAAQIQIFRLEFNEDIERIDMRLPVIRPEVTPPLIHKEEGFGQTDINESFADDSSNLFLFSLKSLSALKNVLTDFKNLSGLSSNFEKSFIMRIGDITGAVSQDILDLGFTFTDKIKLLGFTLQNYGDITAANFEGVRIKIDNLIRFWERFFLSLPGRITIYKTLLIPQINYFASILTPSHDTILNLQLAMERFVLGGLPLARDRIYKKVGEGGLGLFNLADFISALQCTWIKRCVQSINDNWKYRLALYGNGNPTLVVNDDTVRQELGTVLNMIVFASLKGSIPLLITITYTCLFFAIRQ
jgi:hypothetical protein